jgi:hypothetical protein
MCGDWNTRVGNLHPTIGEIDVHRVSLDPVISARAQWLIALCEIQGWHILNGIQPGPPAVHTCKRGTGQSCIDLVMATDPTHQIEYDPDTLQGLTDHTMLTMTMALPQLQAIEDKRKYKQQPEVIYKWVEGTCVQNYA